MTEKRRDKKNRILHTGESQRKDGRYAYKYTDPCGKQRFVYAWKLVPTDRTPKGKREGESLREKEKKVKRDLEDGIIRPGKQMTVCQLYAKQIRYRANVREGTKRQREMFQRILENDRLGAYPIENVKLSDAKEWAVRMHEKGYAFHTVKNYKRSLKAAFYTAVQDDYLRKNPFDFKLNEVIPDKTVPKSPLTEEQETALLTFMETDTVYRKYYDETVILLGTGLRVSELCGLTEDDVDLNRRQVHVNRQLIRKKGGGCYVEKPKTECGRRTVFMSERVRCAFLRVLARGGRGRSTVIDGYSGFLFTSKSGVPKVASDYQGAFKRMLAKYRKLEGAVALPEVLTLHSLRHTFCTNLAHAGMNPKALQYVMGHADIKMTLGYYAHATVENALGEMRRCVA